MDFLDEDEERAARRFIQNRWRTSTSVRKRRYEIDDDDNWESTLNQMVKKILDTVVIVGATVPFKDECYAEAASIFSVMDLKVDEFLRNVYIAGNSLELHFISVYRRDYFLDRLRRLIKENGDCGIAARCHPLSKRNGILMSSLLSYLSKASFLEPVYYYDKNEEIEDQAARKNNRSDNEIDDLVRVTKQMAKDARIQYVKEWLSNHRDVWKTSNRREEYKTMTGKETDVAPNFVAK
ncbi:hypothetical protein ANCCAN_25607 [Ancylostoma caninum]|uniref:Uncharacterized protein n=1 Tax=Ancylostoma caninum TaxID=29170 RepID=A0A368FEQ0_ANCCA|nr:hypothetical protein ANCCAN_25607 [Ancylostoma caninum]